MSDHENPNDPGGIAPGQQPEDVETLQYGKGPGEPEMQPPDFSGGHPKGLWVLFITEMWERFSYYGMRALLVLFLVASTAEPVTETIRDNPGFGWAEADAYTLYGVYTFMVYLTSIFGGFIADRLLGTHKAMVYGGWAIAFGHITLALSSLFSFERGPMISADNGIGALTTFLFGLSLIIIGTGFFKPCVSVMVGQLYGEGDPRRDSGFTIYYMGINLGAFMSPLVAGTLGENVGWHWGFGSAAVGMLVCLFCYQALRPRFLKGIGDGPESGMASKDRPLVAFSLAGLIAIPILPLLIFRLGFLDDVLSVWSSISGTLGLYGMAALIGVLFIGSIGAFLAMQRPEERSKLAVICVLAFIANLGFWTAFEQAGSSMNVFAADSTDRTLWGMLENPFPATWYQSVNALTIIICAPIFSWLWLFLAKRKLEPSTPMKFVIGLWLLGLAFIAMVAGAWETRNGGLAGPQWLLLAYIVVTWGELCLSPVGLSMVTKLAPLRLQSLMMGLWWFSFALSNLCAGLVARMSTKFIPQGDQPAEMTFMIEGMAGFYLMLVVVPIVIGFLILLMTPFLRKMMKGEH
ncbi:MAG: peptide MFS transporter [Planctomycetota bacterium]|jgi:POT family proton-dependent oligopeptide transporter